MKVEELYVSTDIESDGPVPGLYSMLSVGSAVFNAKGEMLDTFSVNLELLTGAMQHPDTMAFWARNQAAYDATRVHTWLPATAMHAYATWIKALPGRPVFVAYPAGFDFTFVSWYLNTFAGENPFGFSALDIKSYAMGILGAERFTGVTKRAMPRHWFPKRKHTHIALDDAIEQGQLFINMKIDRG